MRVSILNCMSTCVCQHVGRELLMGILCMNAALLSIVVVKTFQDLFSRTWNILDTSLRKNLSEPYQMLTNMRRDSAHTDKRGGVCYAISKGMHGKMEVVNSLHCRSFLSDIRHDMVMPLVDASYPWQDRTISRFCNGTLFCQACGCSD